MADPVFPRATYAPPQKAVALLIAMGQPNASALLERLTTAETETLMSTSRKMRAVSHDDLVAIVEDFERAFAKGASIINTQTEFQTLVLQNGKNAGLPPSNPAETGTQIAAGMSAWEAIEGASTDEILEFLANESPQVAAYVLTRMSGEKTGSILQAINPAERAEVFREMATMRDAVSPAIEAIEDAVTIFFAEKQANNNFEKIANLAKILNSIDRETADSAIASLMDKITEKEIAYLKSMMFRFEDVVKLEAAVRSAIFDSVNADTLTMALRQADEDLREAILSAISQRTRRIIENDLKADIKVNSATVRAAQMSIVATVMRLSAQGNFQLPSAELEAA
ncbi:MAG: FliG C-terminal domain-containing protein [Rhizobiaceae bacterium]